MLPRTIMNGLIEIYIYVSCTIGAFESLDNVMFMMRSQYGMQTDAMMWETIIVEASKLDSVIGEKSAFQSFFGYLIEI